MVKLRHWQIEELYGSYHQKEKENIEHVFGAYKDCQGTIYMLGPKLSCFKLDKV